MLEKLLEKFFVNTNNAPIFNNIQEFKKFWEKQDNPETNLILYSGGFDPIHPGHIDYLQSGHDKIIGPFKKVVIVNGDNFLTNKKGKPFMDLKTRSKIVSCIRGVDYVVRFEVENDQTVSRAIECIRPEYFAKGGDRKDVSTIPEWDICNKVGTKILLKCGIEKTQSSSGFLMGNPSGEKNEN